VDVVFSPSSEDMYPESFSTFMEYDVQVTEIGLDKGLEKRS
jgi:hypothetical protein